MGGRRGRRRRRRRRVAKGGGGRKEKSGELDAKRRTKGRADSRMARPAPPKHKDIAFEAFSSHTSDPKNICELTHSLSAPSVLRTSPAPFPDTSQTTTQSHQPPISDPPILGPPSTGPLFLFPCTGSYSGIGIVLGAGFFVSRNLTESLSMRGIV